MAGLSRELERVLEALCARHESVLDLDTISESIGTLPVSANDIDALFSALEARGITVGNPEARPASADLGRVLSTARELKARRGRTPTAQEIAEASGLTPNAVRLALLFARIVQR